MLFSYSLLFFAADAHRYHTCVIDVKLDRMEKKKNADKRMMKTLFMIIFSFPMIEAQFNKI